MTASRPDLSICIVNHNTPELTRACLRSIFTTAGGLGLEVFVVNNTPDTDGAFSALVRDFPVVRAIQNAAPLGFAANQNRMLSQASGRYLAPLNSDVIVHPGALQALIAFMDAHPQVGLAGPKLVYADGRLQPSCRSFPAPLPTFMEVTGLWRLFKGNRWMARYVALCDPHTDVTEPDWLSGACYILRRDVYERVGGYDADLFPTMYGEDLEWCWRIRRAGWRVAFVPEAVVTHLESRSAASDRLYMMYEGSVKFIDRWCSPAWSFSVRTAASVGVLLRWLRVRDAHERAAYRRILRLLLTGSR